MIILEAVKHIIQKNFNKIYNTYMYNLSDASFFL